jgi:hypothetical protein
VKRIRVFLHFAGVVACFCFCVAWANAQATAPSQAFTMTIQTTVYDARDQVVATSTATRYESASGDWRYVHNVGGFEMATLYRRGRGVYSSDSRTQLIFKETSHAPGCPTRTAEQLRKDPKFVRTEFILGFEAYFLRERLPNSNVVMETSFVPELGGGTPFKSIYTYDDGRKIIEQPTSVVVGEPIVADLHGPDYAVIEDIPVFDKELKDKIISQPKPVFPTEADSGGFGNTVFISVVVDENGRVLTAVANTPITFLAEPAVAAAYQATFKPFLCNGKPVLARGLLPYKYASAHLAKK